MVKNHLKVLGRKIKTMYKSVRKWIHDIRNSQIMYVLVVLTLIWPDIVIPSVVLGLAFVCRDLERLRGR